MSGRKILLLEPPYKNKYPPMGLMKLATYFRHCGDSVYFFKGELKKLAVDLLCDELLVELNEPKILRSRSLIFNYIKSGKKESIANVLEFLDQPKHAIFFKYRQKYINRNFPKFDIIGITTLFTFYWKETITTINNSKEFLKKGGQLLIGGIASTILPEEVCKETGIKPITGLLNKPGIIDNDNDIIIDELPLDYSILDEIDYVYPANDAYFAYMTRGCINKCTFCAVPCLEPQFCNYVSIKEQIRSIDDTFGQKRSLLLMDNNVLASNRFDEIIDEIKKCGFQKNAKYTTSNEYEKIYNSIVSCLDEKNINRGYIIKMIKIYDQIADKLSEESQQANFYVDREKYRLLYPALATKENIIKFDKVARPLYLKTFKASIRNRFVDFNQGIDARLVTEQNMKKMAEIAIRPLRIAFDYYEMKDIYVKAVRTAAKHGIKDLSNYLLYNFNDKPEHLYERLRINIDLCEELGISIYSFPMKYHPIADKAYFNNRNYIGKYWNRKFIRAVQAVLNATKGKVGRGKSFFEEAFGQDVHEFMKILWMPETFIIYRRKYDEKLRERLSDKYDKKIENRSNYANEWWIKFQQLDDNQIKIVKSIVSKNDFNEESIANSDRLIYEVLKYYKIERL